MTNHEIKKETLDLLKKKGFLWESKDKLPKQSVVTDWLRDEYAVFIDIHTHASVNEILGFDVTVRSWWILAGKSVNPQKVIWSYQDHVEEGIIEAVKLIPKKDG